MIFSCDENGIFYIKDHVCDEWIKNKSFLPVMDFETGDYAGFKVNGGICENKMLLYSHEQDELLESADDFFDCILKYGFNQN